MDAVKARRLVPVMLVAALAVSASASASARPDTTNAPAFLTIKVTITDSSVTVKPSAALRGTNAIFILTNRGKSTQKWVIGNATRGVGKTSGFATVLRPDQQKNVVMYLDYRGQLPYSTTKLGGAAVHHGNFKIR
jgi:hypothetical protein